MTLQGLPKPPLSPTAAYQRHNLQPLQKHSPQNTNPFLKYWGTTYLNMGAIKPLLSRFRHLCTGVKKLQHEQHSDQVFILNVNNGLCISHFLYCQIYVKQHSSQKISGTLKRVIFTQKPNISLNVILVPVPPMKTVNHKMHTYSLHIWWPLHDL